MTEMQGRQRWEPSVKFVPSLVAAAVGEEEEEEAGRCVCHAHHLRASGVNCEKAGAR